MFECQQRQYQHGKSVSDWVDDYMRLRTKFSEFNTELTMFTNKYGYGNGSHDMQTGAASGMPSKKRVRWSNEEHKLFVSGVAKYGKGRWKSISEDVLPSKTPSQIASHAQKYFIRQAAQKKKKRRRSIHDITTTVNEYHDQAMLPPPIPPVVHSQNQEYSLPPLPPPPPHNCYDVAAPHDQLHQPTVHVEKESSEEAMVLPHLSSLPYDWDQLLQDDLTTQEEDEEELDFISFLNNSTSHHSAEVHAEKESDEAVILSHVDLPPLPQQLKQQQIYGFGTCDITTQEDEEPDFISYLNNSSSYSPPVVNNNYYDIAAVPTILPQDHEPPRFASCSCCIT